MQPSWDTIPEMVLSGADRFGDAEAVVDGPQRITFSDLAVRVRKAAGAFASLGIDRGDRVAVWAPNSLEWILSAFGVLTAGGTVVPVNTRYKAAEAADIITRSGARAVMVQPDFLGNEYAVPAGIPAIDVRSDFLGSGTETHVPVTGDAVADIMFTSGTTGRSKGVMMNHRQSLRMFAEWCDLADLRRGDTYLIVNPFFHMFGYKAGVIASMIRGARVIPVPVFEPKTVFDLIETERVTMLPGPPTLYHSLLAEAAGRDLSSLRAGVTGSADIPVDLIRRITEDLGFSSIMTGYGLTEAGTCTASRSGDTFEQIATTVGTPCDGIEVRTADDGELLVRGYSVMVGYLDDPGATAEAVDDDGWLHTGDLGQIDPDGHIRIVGRKKDMFIVGGFNAYPAEIENFLLEHPAVDQVAVVGVPDERMGQVGKAFVVASGPLTAPELIAWAKGRMAGFKVPRSVEFRESLPLNATGKVMKDQLLT